LGVDLGQKITGLAISQGKLASPYATITHKSTQEALFKIIDILNKEDIDQVIIGYVEGKIKPYFEKFAKSLEKEKPTLEVILWDETLTTRQATENMIKLGIARKRRRQKEHIVAASLILQSYLDAHD